MCGISGIVWSDASRPVEPALIESMTTAIAHRGPDGHGYHIEPGMAFGHRRLSIIDLEGGKQPLSNEDGTVWVTFNGEIYNFQLLYKELRNRGHSFKTRSDTEVLVHLWEDEGPAMVRVLRGMFAFAIWDSRTRTLFIARDRAGKKPVVYRHTEKGLWFASELKALLKDPTFVREVDHEAIDAYLEYQYVPHPRTIFKGVKKLPPAHWMIYKDGQVQIERYWTPAYHKESKRTWEEDKELVRATLTEATRLRMISEVPIGAFLSGGIDSTIIVGIMQSLSSRPIKSFSIGFPMKEYDETSFARLAAKHIGTEHHEYIVNPDAVSIVDDLAYYYDEPFADSSAIPTYYVSKWTREKVTVALTGDAGDELFLGYGRYYAARLYQQLDQLPKPIRSLLASKLWLKIPGGGKPQSFMRRAKRILEAIGYSAEGRYRNLVEIFSRERRYAIYSDNFSNSLGNAHPEDFVESLYKDFPNRDFLTQTSYVDFSSYLVGDILTKVDIASMAVALECRSPMLDHEFVDLVAALPSDRKMQGTRNKILLKEAFAEHLPPQIKRRGKMGFSVPLPYWFRNELKPLLHEVLFSPRALQRGWFDRAKLETLVQEHASGLYEHSNRLWALVMLELWARTYLDEH